MKFHKINFWSPQAEYSMRDHGSHNLTLLDFAWGDSKFPFLDIFVVVVLSLFSYILVQDNITK